MSWLRSSSALFVMLTVVATAVLAGLWLLPKGSPFLLPLALGGLVALVVMLDRYWKRLDEAAKAAHLSAWYWGGSLGMGVALGLMMPPYGIPTPDVPTDQLMALGGLVMLGGGIVGWLIAWSIWWLRHR